VVVGPFVDDTDGKTVEGALTVSQADCQLIKNAGAAAQKNSATAASHLAGGHYKVPLNATDTNTLGRLRLYVNEGGALPVWRDFMVVPANVWDSYFGADRLQVHAAEISNSLLTAAALDDGAAEMIAGAVWDEALSGHLTPGSTGDALNDAAGVTPSAVADAVWDEALAGHATTGSAGGALAGGMVIADGAITEEAFSSGGLNAIADALLRRDFSSVTGEAARSMLNALRFLRNRWAVNAGALTVYKENDTSVAWEAVATDDAAADPITGVDPA